MLGSQLILLSLLILSPHLVGCTSYENHTQLYDSLFKNYNVNLRPVHNASTVLHVTVDFILLSIEGISEIDQSVTTNGWLLLNWTDMVHTWDENHHGVPFFILQQKTIWLPDVAIKNTVKKRGKMGFDEQPVKFFSNGGVMWAPGDIYYTSCDLSVRYYPFDVQSCNIVVYTFQSDESQIQLTPSEAEIGLKFYAQNGLWEIVSTSTSFKTVDGFSEVTFTMNLRRRRLFYVVNIIVPVVFLSCMTPVVFLLPSDSGEKMGFSVTVLLAYTVFLTILGDTMPRTSIESSLLSFYLLFMVILSAVSVIMASLVLKLHHKPEDTLPSRKLQLIISHLRRCLCLNKTSKVPPAAVEDDTVKAKIGKEELGGTKEERVSWREVGEAVDALCFLAFTLLTLLISAPSITMMAVQGLG